MHHQILQISNIRWFASLSWLVLLIIYLKNTKNYVEKIPNKLKLSSWIVKSWFSFYSKTVKTYRLKYLLYSDKFLLDIFLTQYFFVLTKFPSHFGNKIDYYYLKETIFNRLKKLREITKLKSLFTANTVHYNALASGV